MNIGVQGKKIAFAETGNKHVMGPGEGVSGKPAGKSLMPASVKYF